AADLAGALTRLERARDPVAWSAAQQPWTPDMVRQAASLLGQGPRAEKVAARWADGRSLVWSARDGSGRQVAVGVLRFQDAAGARAYYEFATDLQRKQDE